MSLYILYIKKIILKFVIINEIFDLKTFSIKYFFIDPKNIHIHSKQLKD